MLQRLLGLESEYAIGVSPRDDPASPSNAEVYAAIREAIEQQLCTRSGEGTLQQIFVENGGSFSYESLPWAPDAGLVEGATAECRGPGTLLLYQRAQDAILEVAMSRAQLQLQAQGRPVRLTLRKNCVDAEGNVYGAQENYEAELARGPTLWAWRAGLSLVLPLAAVSTLLTWSLLLLALALSIVLLLPYGLLGLASARVRRQSLYQELFGEGTGHSIEQRLGRPLSAIERTAWEPTLRPFFWLAAALAFHRQRRDAMAFLVTRPVLSGTGTLTSDDTFGLSEKGPAIIRSSRRSVAPSDRAIWDGGNLCKSMLGLAMLRGRRFASLFARRQRLQLGLSDSNVTQVAEYLKVGTTALVLDMAEAGVLRDLPPLRRPVAALHAVIADPSLCAEIRWGDQSLTAVQVQRRYWERACDFVRDSATPSLEAKELVDLWGRTLDALERDPSTQVGRIDWVTKRFLLETAGADEPWAVRKTIDLQMHELGPDGTLWQLETLGMAPRLVSEDEVRAAMREPPHDSPARHRSRIIRDLRDQDDAVKVYWDRVRVGGVLRGRIIRLDDHRRRRDDDDE